MTCNHQFVLIEQTNRRPEWYNPGSTAVVRDEFGAKVGCVLCGEVRIIWSSGELNIYPHAETTGDPKN